VIIYSTLTIICILLIQHLFYLKLVSSNKKKKKYEKSEIRGVNIEEIAINLEKYMSESKIYLDENITLDKLADNLDVPKHYLTQVLNSHLNKNFYKFINHYRIEEAKRIIESKKNGSMKLLDIAFQCGFKSKASFNRYIKMETNFTPSEYRKHLNSKDSIYKAS
jgi:AraC-like DNA-binding protein